jgi:hypothetical protein
VPRNLLRQHDIFGQQLELATLCRQREVVRKAATDIGCSCPQDWPKPGPIAAQPTSYVPEYCCIVAAGELQ